MASSGQRPAGRDAVDDSDLRRILRSTHTIATVGFSSNPLKAAHRVPAYLLAAGYHVIPVNPRVDHILGCTSYPSLEAIPEPVDLVQLFRPSAAVAPFVHSAIAIGAKVIWMQQRIRDLASAELARAAGLEVVMDRCMMVDHRRLLGG
jgi:predicted CoA-binding protein